MKGCFGFVNNDGYVPMSKKITNSYRTTSKQSIRK